MLFFVNFFFNTLLFMRKSCIFECYFCFLNPFILTPFFIFLMKNLLFALLAWGMVSCFTAKCDYPPDYSLGLVFYDRSNNPYPSPYSKVYEKSVLTNIDSTSFRTSGEVNYRLPLPSVKNPKKFCFIFEKTNGQKDSLTFKGELFYEYKGRLCGLVPMYKDIEIIFGETSFPANNISVMFNSFFQYPYVFKIIL